VTSENDEWTADAQAQPDVRRERKKPVQWLNAGQLFRTQAQVNRAKSFALYADRREALASSPKQIYTLSDPVPTQVIVDYVADTGDGFDATFATARCISGGTKVQVDSTKRVGKPEERSRLYPDDGADLLVFGGDEVYPVASPSEYDHRLTNVLRLAAELDKVEGRPPVVALPGNHDWYDGLASWRRLFCESSPRPEQDSMVSDALTPVPEARDRGSVGGWGAFQSRSYFAIQLTERWWLWAVDSQLDAPVDTEQMNYFRDAARLLDPNKHRLILCTATPCWMEAEDQPTTPYAAPPDSPLFSMLWFIDRTLGMNSAHDVDRRHMIRLVLTGDQHYYARHTPVRGTDYQTFAPELVTCGGGGAFLSSTHHLKRHLWFTMTPWARYGGPGETSSGDTTSPRYRLEACYPDESTSKGLFRRLPRAWRCNGFTMHAVLALVDLTLFFAILDHSVTELKQRPVPVYLAGLLILGGFTFGYAYAGANKHAVRWRWASVLAAVHLLLQLVAIMVAVGVYSALARPLGVSRADGHQTWIGLALVGLCFVVLGAVAMVMFLCYLWIADRVNCHSLEAFSGMQIADYKCHLRLKVAGDQVEVFVVAIDEVPKTREIFDARRLDDAKPKAYVLRSFRVGWDYGDTSTSLSSRTADGSL
jgi:hypothetical protein